ncbi:MAG TPA: 2,3-bisphosphoglycerate-independent phosphoglycerate mutase [Candidatus Paceibacterota bacterium]|nr:2,3-bisphosphoglycerate-independent phosphoglycerate mutase [Candidatus Paceibacterota bacterium]
MQKKPVCLVVLDGWGFREEKENNAIAEANLPFYNKLWQEFPHTLLKASGLAVGLPEGQMGNSEVGHMIIGAGKIIYTDLVRINKSIEDKSFFENETILKLFEHAKKNDSTFHALGLIGPGGVHAYSEHLFALIKAAKEFGLKKFTIHAFTDGRDTPPQSAAEYLIDLEKEISDIGIGFIASMTGRYYAMDRDKNWDRLKKAEDAIFSGEGMQAGAQKAEDVAKLLYSKNITDEYFEPVVFLDKEGQKELIRENDAVFFFNFRADRARMLSEKIINFAKDRNILFGTMTEYDKNFDCLVAFKPIEIETTLAKEISRAGLTQAHVAETEKYAHATYFLNGGKEETYEGEQDILVPSRKDVATHDLAPEMKAVEIADEVIKQIESGVDFIFVNFANADMVGHTANKEAIITGLETVDKQLERIFAEVNKKNGIMFITADHGNAELNFDTKTGKKHTAHTTNPVPFICTDKDKKLKENSGTLADITPTVFDELDIKKPESMTGISLFEKNS